MSRLSDALEELVRAITEEIAGVAVNRALNERERRATSDATGISATAAARIAGCRDGHVLAALRGGGLRGNRSGNRWVISSGELRRWVDAGRQLEAVA